MADKNIVKQQSRVRRRKHLKKNIRGTEQRPRLVVFRSNKQIYGQIVDDVKHVTLVAASTTSKDIEKDIGKAKSKVEKAKIA